MARNWKSVIAPLALAAAFIAFYAFCAQQGMSWQDSGEFQFRVMTNDLAWHSGIARAHPGYIQAARTFAKLAYAVTGGAVWTGFGVTLFSGFAMSVALLLLYTVVRRLTGKSLPALVAALTLGLAHMAWWMSCVAEVYTSSLLFSMMEFLILCAIAEHEGRRSLLVPMLFLFAGDHFSFHNFALLNLPVYVVFAAALMRRTMRPLRLACIATLSAALFCLGAFPVLRLAAASLAGGTGFGDVCASVLFGTGYRGAVLGLSRPDVARVLASYAFAALSVISPAWLLAPAGMRAAPSCDAHMAVRRALIALTAIHAVFWCRYFVPDQATFVIPLLGYLSIWVGIGASRITPRALRVIVIASAAVQLVLPNCALYAARQSPLFHRVMSARREVPFRNEAAYWIQPWKRHEHSADEFVKWVIIQMPPGGTLYADPTTAPPLMMLQAAGGDEGLGFRLLTPWSAGPLPEADDKTFCVSGEAPYVPAKWRERCDFAREGMLHRAMPR